MRFNLKRLQSGERLIVAGNEGQVILNPRPAVVEVFYQLFHQEKQRLEHAGWSKREIHVPKALQRRMKA